MKKVDRVQKYKMNDNNMLKLSHIHLYFVLLTVHIILFNIMLINSNWVQIN